MLEKLKFAVFLATRYATEPPSLIVIFLITIITVIIVIVATTATAITITIHIATNTLCLQTRFRM